MANDDIEKRLWSAADQLWANTGLKPSEFSTPVLMIDLERGYFEEPRNFLAMTMFCLTPIDIEGLTVTHASSRPTPTPSRHS